jgi:hypothetical protein
MPSPKDILHRSSKKLAIQAAQLASDSEEFREELVSLAINNDMPVSSRAAWSLLTLAEKHPELVTPYIKLILDNLNTIENHTQISSLLRLFDTLKTDLDECGQLFDFCIHILRIPLEREYSRAIAMNILVKFGKAYPELVPEIKEQISISAPNFKANHAKRKAAAVLKMLSQ